MTRAYAPLFMALAVLATACSDDDDDDDKPSAPSAPSGDPLSVYLSNNGPGNQGEVDQFDQAFVAVNTTVPGNNQGVALDVLGNLYQAGDLAGGTVRVFSKVGSRPSLNPFDLSVDRELGGPSAGMSEPKGIAVAHEAGLLMIADNGVNSVFVYGTAAGGDSLPLAITALPSAPWDLAYDEGSDRLFLAMTDGTVAVFDGYVAGDFAPGFPATPTRTINPVDGAGAAVSTNLHGIAYDSANDRLVVSDVGDTAINDDGALLMITGASTADGDTVPARIIRGPLTLLGNPVDVVLDGQEVRVAEKENDLLLLFTDVFTHAGGDVAPRLSVSEEKPEAMVLEPDSPTLGDDVSDIDDSATPLDGLLVASNPGGGAPETGDLRRLDLTLSETAFFEGLFELENVTLDQAGDACVSFDDGIGLAGGLLFVNRLAKGRDGDTVNESRDRTLMGASTTLVSPKGVEIVDGRGRVLVAENGAAAPSVLVFSTSAMDDAAPLATIPLTVQPWDLDYDPGNDRLFVALTDGSVAVFDAFFNLPFPTTPDRVITISDGLGAQESVNLHGIVYDAVNDVLIVSDVGDTAVATDGVIYTIDAASAADGLTDPTVRIGGAATLLGNPVDLAYDGQNLFVAEKSNGMILRFDDVLTSAGGDIAPNDDVVHVSPESVCLVPSGLSPASGGSIF